MNLVLPFVKLGITRARQVAVVDDRRSYTYGHLLGGGLHVAEHLDTVTDADHVGLLLPTSGAFPTALLGTWLAGRVAVPLNYLLSAGELRYVIHNSGIDTLITVGPMLEFIGEDVIPEDIRVVRLDGDLDFSGFPPLRWPPNPRGDELAVLLYTSGTSGRPKGVMLTHRNLRENVDGAIEHAGFSAANTFLGVLPQFHSFGLTGLTLLPLRVGAKVVYTARFVPKKVVRLIREHRPDIFMAVPSMYGALLSVKGAEKEDFASVTVPVSGGEPLPDATFERCRERFGLRILEGYGLTETAPITNWSTPRRHRRYSVGPSLPNVRVVVVDEQDRSLPPNEEGEILIAGPNVMAGYYRLPDQTAEVFVDLAMPDDRGGPSPRRFFRTGDIGKLDDDGYLYITGRKKEMLIIGGENVFPREIEEVLNRHETVGDSAVIGRSDGVRGEVPVAFVEVVEGAEFDGATLRTWCRQHLAPFKVPREIHAIDALPRNPTGKIMRRKLAAP